MYICKIIINKYCIASLLPLAKKVLFIYEKHPKSNTKVLSYAGVNRQVQRVRPCLSQPPVTTAVPPATIIIYLYIRKCKYFLSDLKQYFYRLSASHAVIRLDRGVGITAHYPLCQQLFDTALCPIGNVSRIRRTERSTVQTAWH